MLSKYKIQRIGEWFKVKTFLEITTILEQKSGCFIFLAREYFWWAKMALSSKKIERPYFKPFDWMARAPLGTALCGHRTFFVIKVNVCNTYDLYRNNIRILNYILSLVTVFALFVK